MNNNNKRILFNTGIMYMRLIVNTIIGLLVSRFVLQALGASDYGLYAVVGGLIAMLNVLSTAMYTTTRRFINVEMGKPDGNLNRIFNISRLIHIGFAIFIFIIAESIGVIYIKNYLNVEPSRSTDAMFVFQISTLAACASIINVPYQSLLEAFEKFFLIAICDVLGCILKLAFVISLLYYSGDVLRAYSIGISLLTVFTLSFYSIACLKKWKGIVKYRLYKEKSSYKEILFFNNYVALGATSSICRTQGSTLLINFFFGTVVNAAFAIAYSIENYCVVFVNNLGSAASPQITQNYSKNNDRSFFLTGEINRLTIFLMLIFVVPLSMEMDFILKIWLNETPDGTALFCHLTLLSALIRVITGGTAGFIQASGKIKWFQIIGSTIEISCIPISYILLDNDSPAYVVIIVFALSSIVFRFISFALMHRLLAFEVKRYCKFVYISPLISIVILIGFAYIYHQIPINSSIGHIGGILLCIIATIITIIVVGLNSEEKRIMTDIIRKKNRK